jgi:DNA-directed RNA polymerase subunit RPC12/RpoP
MREWRPTWTLGGGLESAFTIFKGAVLLEIDAVIGFIPKCPQKEVGCTGTMSLIEGQDRAYKCSKCGAEIWLIRGLTFREINDKLHSSTREIMCLSYGPINKKGRGSRNGRKRKKKGTLHKNYYFETRSPNIKK